MIVSGRDLSPDQEDFLERTAASIMQKGSFRGKELVDRVVGMLEDDGIDTQEPGADSSTESQ